MSQHTTRHDPRAKSEDEDAVGSQALQPEHKHGVRPRRPVGQPAGDDGAGPAEPDEGELEVVGDDDLGAADLGPLAPDFRDPDTDSERIRKIAR
jgi:hypothetical protein